MKRAAATLIAVFLVCGLWPTASGQTVMHSGTTITVTGYGCASGIITDDGGTEGNYTDMFDGTLLLRWDIGEELHLTGDYDTEDGYDYLRIYENGSEIYYASGTGSIDLTSTAGELQLVFHTDGSVTRTGFALNWETGAGTVCAHSVENLTWSESGEGTVVLNWVGTGSGYGVNVDGIDYGTTATTTMTLTGLSPAQAHTVTVYPTDDASPCCAATINLRTGCGRMTLPWIESFEDVTVGELPPCWIRTANFDDAVTRPRVVGTTASDGLHSLMLSCGSTPQGGHFGLLATPPFAGLGDHTVKLDLMATHNGTVVVVGTMAESAMEYDTSTLVRIDTLVLNDEGRWHSYTFTWDATEEGQRLVLMMKQSDQGGSGRMVYIDGGRVADCGVSALRATTTRDTMARLEWDSYGSPTCRIGVREAGSLNYTTTIENAVSPLTVTGLNPETDYSFTIFASCGAGYSACGSTTVRTDPAPDPAAGFCAGFASSTTWPSGWTAWNDTTACTSLYRESEGIHFYKGCGYEQNDSTTLVGPRLTGLAGKRVTVKMGAWPHDYSFVVVGTVGDAYNRNSFRPIDTLRFNNDRWDWTVRMLSFTVPADDTSNHIGIRFNSSQNAVDARLEGVVINDSGDAFMSHVAHIRGTSIELRWNEVRDSVVVEYGPDGFEPGTGMRDTVTGTDRATVRGLSPWTTYDFYTYGPGETACIDLRVRSATRGSDHEMPLCERFDERWNLYDDDWDVIDWINSMPSVVDHPYFSEAGRCATMLSYGFENSYYSTFAVPDMPIDTGTVVSFYATSTTPVSSLVVGMQHYDNSFHPIDTVAIQSGRTHYTLPLDDSICDAEGRLAFKWFHPSQYSIQYLYIDELNIDTSAYDYVSPVFVGYDTATFSLPNLTGADSVLLTLVGGGDTLSYVWTPAGGDLGVNGLDTGTLYYVYLNILGDSGASCLSYTGYIITSADGDGIGIPSCNDFDGLLSYEKPAWWHFADSARVDDGVLVLTGLATLPPAGYANGTSMAVRMLTADTLFIGYTYDSVGFTPTDTVTDLMSVFYLHDLPDTAILAVMAPDTVRIDMIGMFGCPIVDFKGIGGKLTCTVRGDAEPNYILYLQEAGSPDVRTIHITRSPYEVSGLGLGTTYQLTYHCINGYTGCAPTLMVTIDDSLALPLCEQFGEMPQGWSFYYDDDVQPSVELNWGGGPLRFGEWGRQNQMLVMPTVAYNDAVTVQIHGHQWSGQIMTVGTVDASGDTSTYTPLATSPMQDGWFSLTLGIDSLGSRRIAMRANDLVLIQSVGILPQPRMKASLYTSRVLTIEADRYTADDTLYVRYNDNYGYDSIITVYDMPYELPLQDGVNSIRLTQVTNSMGDNCNAETFEYTTGTAVDVPFCSMTNLSNYTFHTYSSSQYKPSLSTYNEKYSYRMESSYDVEDHEYLVLPEINTADISEMTVGFSLISYWLGDTVEVGVMTDAFDTNTFVPVGYAAFADSATMNWETHEVSLASYSGSGRWIAFRHHSHPRDNSTVAYLRLTDFVVSPCAGMANVTTATATHTRWNIVTINAADTGFMVQYVVTGQPLTSGTIVRIDSLPYELTLAPKTYYDIYFLCDSTHPSCRPGVQIGTLDEPIELPVCIDFDTMALNQMPSSWRSTGTAQAEATGHSGDRSLGLFLSGYSDARYIVSPEISTDSITGNAISVWLKNEECSTVEIGTMNSPNDYNSFFSLLSCTPTSEWTKYTVSMADAPNTARYIAFRASSCSWNNSTLYIDDLSISGCAAYGLRARDVNFDNITLDWTQVGSPTITVSVVQDSVVAQTIMPLQPPLTIFGLSPHSRYVFRFTASCASSGSGCYTEYADSVTMITAADGAECVNPTDLNSPNSVFFSGNYYNPYAGAGAIDYGVDSEQSRHTVCTDTTARDPRTGGQLRMVPEGYTSSVRLGNWSTNPSDPEAEGVIYSLFVDTANFQLLLLHYAAVLQDPMHAPEDQPRFRLELLDSNFAPIDPDCSSADFVANQSLGWNTAANGVLWKDWTSVGIDLSSYADQQVYVRLTTYDCNEGSHYGYAYFTLECMRKALATEACGDQEYNTLTAPAGFNYRWYNSNSTATIATTQSITIPTADITYYCDLSKIDNDACLFTISAYGGTRYPMASFDTVTIINNCHFHVTFVNTSSVSKDNVTPIAAEQCETAFWDYGNGQTSTNYNGSATYMLPGVYTVMLVSGIADGACQDTTYMTLNLTLPDGMQPTDTTTAEICLGESYTFRSNTFTQSGTYYIATPNPGLCDSIHTLQLTAWAPSYSDTVAEACDTMTWRGTLFDTTGIYPFPLPMPDMHGCDSIRLLRLTIHSSIDTIIDDTIVEAALPYPVAGTNLTMANFDTTGDPDHVGIHWVLHYTTIHGCDSTMDFRLTVWRNRDTAFSATTCRNTLPYMFNGTPLSPSTDETTYTFHLPTAHGADSTITFTLFVVDNPEASYADTIVENQLPHTFRGVMFNGPVDTTFIFPSAACDTIAHYTLTVWPNLDTAISRNICRNQLPYQLDSALFDSIPGLPYTASYADTIVIVMSDCHGADSTVTYIVNVGGIYELADTIVICPNKPYIYHGVDYGGPTVVDVMLSTAADCDSLVHVTLVPRDSNYRPETFYRFDNQPWERPDSVLLGCSTTTLNLMDTTPETISRLWFLATADTAVYSSDSVFSFEFVNSDNPSTATAGIVIENNNGCIDTLAWPVLVFRSPRAEFIWDPEVPVMSHPETQFYNRSTLDSAAWSPDSTYPLTYLWQIGSPTGDGDTSSAINPHYSWGEGNDAITGDAEVTLTAYWLHTLDTIDFGPFDSIAAASFSLGSIMLTCPDSITHTVTITNDYLQFPNLVSPNGDGVNDTWRIVNLVEYGEYPTNELWIYNQWGALVYHAKNIRTEDEHWDPNETNSPDGAYYYRFTARGRFGITKRNGLIEVVR